MKIIVNLDQDLAGVDLGLYYSFDGSSWVKMFSLGPSAGSVTDFEVGGLSAMPSYTLYIVRAEPGSVYNGGDSEPFMIGESVTVYIGINGEPPVVVPPGDVEPPIMPPTPGDVPVLEPYGDLWKRATWETVLEPVKPAVALLFFFGLMQAVSDNV